MIKPIPLNPCYNPPQLRISGDCPPIYVGLEVLLSLNYKPECRLDEIYGSEAAFKVIDQVGTDMFIGQMQRRMDDLPEGTTVQFSSQHVQGVQGDLEYMIRYQAASVSNQILQSRPVGFYYFSWADDPFHCGRYVFSIDDDPHLAQEETEEISLVRLLQIAPELHEHFGKLDTAIRCGEDFVPFWYGVLG